MINWFRSRNTVGLIVALACVCLTLTSCETLRKKFTRHKKHAQEEENNSNFIPVLEPQEYPAPEHDPVEMYKQHYALIKAWYHDFWAEIDDKDTGKRQMYTLKQVIGHIEEMKRLVTPETAARLDKLEHILDYYKESLNQPLSQRNIGRIQSDLRSFDRMLRSQLRADKLKGGFVSDKQ